MKSCTIGIVLTFAVALSAHMVAAADDEATRFEIVDDELIIPGVGHAEGKPDEAFFVRCDRTTMSEADLDDELDLLRETYPASCDDDGCWFNFTYDADAGAHRMDGEPGWFVISVPQDSAGPLSIRKYGNLTLKRGKI